jgi:hypothetical protein
MTLNQVIARIKKLSLGHKLVRSFRKGMLQDLFADKTALYPVVCLQDNGGNISLGGHQATLNYRLFVLDLVHVSADTKTNEDDVLSDTLSILMDLIAQMNNGNYDDWKLSSDNSVQFLVENENDMQAGVVLDLTISFIYSQNVCQVPTDIEDYTTTDPDMKFLYDEQYVATGNEGRTLTIPMVAGKKILYITRGGAIIYKVSNDPASSEYTWNYTDIGLGADTITGERFLILYRNE